MGIEPQTRTQVLVLGSLSNETGLLSMLALGSVSTSTEPAGLVSNALPRHARARMSFAFAFAFGFAFAFAFGRSAAADVDWSKGLITAEGVGIANRHAPSPAVAREPARRMAEEAAKKALAAQLPAIPHARGGTVGDLLANTSTQQRVAEVIDRAITVAATPHTDGSWNVTLAIPIEALRFALDGNAARPVVYQDVEPPIVIVEGVTAKPAVGYSIGHWAAAVLWVKEVPAWANTAPRVKSTATKPGLIEIPDGKPIARTPAPAAHPSAAATQGPPPTTTGGPSTLYIVITRP